MAGKSRAYPKEFREDAVRLYRTSGKSLANVSRELGIAVESLRKWIKQSDLDSGARSDGLTTEERDELRRLRRENRVLLQEREILKKPRPSSLRRARAGAASGVPVHRAREGPDPYRLPRPRRLPQRISHLAGAAAGRAGPSKTRSSPCRSARSTNGAAARTARRGSTPSSVSRTASASDASASPGSCAPRASLE